MLQSIQYVALKGVFPMCEHGQLISSMENIKEF